MAERVLNENERIAYVREFLSLSQADFAQRIGISQGALSQIENSKTGISLETLVKITRQLNVDCNWLVHGVGEVFLTEQTSHPKFSEEYIILPADQKSKKLIPFVKHEANAGYIRYYQDQKYIEKLDAYHIPGFEHGDYRMFEVVGDSMVPTFYPGEIVISEYQKEEDIEDGSICIIITQEEVLVKRYYKDQKAEYQTKLKSDNAKYKTQYLPKDQMLEIWVVKAKITSVFTELTDHYSKRFHKLESEIEKLWREFKEVQREPDNDKKQH